MNTHIFSFTPDSMTCDGVVFPAGYSVTPTGAVVVFVTVPGSSDKKRVRFDHNHPAHAAALAAAKGERPAPIPEQPAEVPAAQVEQPAEVPAAPVEQPAEVPAAPVESEKQTRGPVPEKTFIGDTIQGKGWKIFFDGDTARTRVIFEGAPTDVARAAVEKAGFYFSSAMNSWNKKLTFRAYRAAQALSCELSALYA